MNTQSPEAWVDTPLIREVRLWMREAAGEGSPAAPETRAGLRRALSGLESRLERLRRSFPDAVELLDRVQLSPHVTSLLEEGRALPLLCVDEGPGQ